MSANDNSPDPANTPPPPPPPPSGTDNARTFTQEDLNRVAAREKDEGKRSAERAILAALGVDDLDSAKKILADKQAADEAKLSEVDKREKAATKAQTEAAEAKATATKMTLDAKVERAILEKLLGEEQVKALSAAATLRRLIEVTPDADDKAISDAVTELATTMPHLFQVVPPSNDGGNGRPPVKPSTPPPPGPPRSSSSSSGSRDEVTTLLHARHPNLAKNQGGRPGRP